MRCPICEKIFGSMTHNHLKYKHNMTMDEFIAKYPTFRVHTCKAQISMAYAKIKEVQKPWTCSD